MDIDSRIESALDAIRGGYDIGYHNVAGPYIAYPGAGFNRIVLVNEKEDQYCIFGVAIGDTADQAKRFYRVYNKERIRQLENYGWEISSNFHLAWQRKIIFCPEGHKSLPLYEYIDTGLKYYEQGIIRQYKRAEFERLKNFLIRSRIMDDHDSKNFDNYFQTHKYNSAIVCPSINVYLKIPMQIVMGNFEKLIIELNERKDNLIDALGNETEPRSINIDRRINGPTSKIYACDLCGDEVPDRERVKHRRDEHPEMQVLWKLVNRIM